MKDASPLSLLTAMNQRGFRFGVELLLAIMAAISPASPPGTKNSRGPLLPEPATEPMASEAGPEPGWVRWKPKFCPLIAWPAANVASRGPATGSTCVQPGSIGAATNW